MLTVLPNATVGDANDLVIVGGAATVTVAVFDAAPAPDSVALIGPVVLFLIPVVVPVTVTVIVQLAPAANVPPVNVRVSPPVMTRLPPHGVVVPLGAVNPAGSVSVKATPVSAAVLGFVSRKLRLRAPDRATVGAANDLAIVGGATTVTVAVLDAVPEPDSVELIAPVALFLTPAVVPVTVTVIVQLPPAAKVPPVNVS